MRVLLLLLTVVLLTAACQRQAAAPPPAPAPAAQNLLTYPGATQTNASSYSGAGPSGNAGQWSTVTMETTDPYEKVRDFYKANAPSGYAQSFMNESASDGNREFALWFARQDGQAWYVITIHEEKDEGKVVVSVATGQAAQ